MNIAAAFREIHNAVKHIQISEEELTSENFGEAAFKAGQYDMSKILTNLYNGDISERQLKVEVGKLKRMGSTIN